MPYLFLTFAFVCNAGANVLLKLSALRHFSFGETLKFHFTSGTWYFAGALALFALNLCFYVVALQRIPLSIGYPVMVGMTFLITIGASVFLGEKIQLIHALGIALILSGIFLIVRFAQV